MAGLVQRQAGRVHQLGDERLHRVIRSDAVERHWNFLPALPAEGDVHVPVRIHRGIAHGMQIVGDLHAKRKREGRALYASHAHAHRAAHRAFRHPRNQQIIRGHDQTGFGWAKLHLRARVIAHRKPVAPDGKLASRQRGSRLDAFNSRQPVHFCEQSCFPRDPAPARPTCGRKLRMERRCLKPGRARNPQSHRGVNSRDPVVCHDAQAARQKTPLAAPARASRYRIPEKV